MQIINRQKFVEWSKTSEGQELLVDFIESLPRALSIRGSNLSTPQMRLQHALEADGIAHNVPVPEDRVAEGYTPVNEEVE